MIVDLDDIAGPTAERANPFAQRHPSNLVPDLQASLGGRALRADGDEDEPIAALFGPQTAHAVALGPRGASVPSRPHSAGANLRREVHQLEQAETEDPVSVTRVPRVRIVERDQR